jgi:hypothetical protein
MHKIKGGNHVINGKTLIYNVYSPGHGVFDRGGDGFSAWKGSGSWFEV